MSSFSAFNDVDATVAKPVLGSDGAARWQDFRSNNKLPQSSNVAPAIPLKKLDRALGTTSLNDERAAEARVRKEGGDAESGSGYTQFKRKTDQEEVAERKRRRLVLERVRPKDVPFYLSSTSFQTHKHDYVFTTKDRGTGYYWDGNDSIRKELGKPSLGADFDEEELPALDYSSEHNILANVEKKKVKKKKKKKNSVTQEPEDDQFNPMFQVAQALQRRDQILGSSTPVGGLAPVDIVNAQIEAAALGIKLPTTTPNLITVLEPQLTAAGWDSAVDPSTTKTYYFKRSTNERSWTKPTLPKELPEGWKLTADKTGKVYYYHTASGKTSWEKPK